MSRAPQDGRATLAEIFAAARSGDLSAVELRLWLIVRGYDSGSGCYAATDTLAAEMRLSRRYIESLRSGLVKRGWLKLTFRGPKEPMLQAVTPQEAPHYTTEQEQEAPHYTTEQEQEAPHKAPNHSSVRVRGVREETPSPTPPCVDVGAEVEAVFDRCRSLREERLGKVSGPALQLTQARRSKISARLGEGFTVADLEDAARGFYSDTWKDRDRYLDPSFCFKNDETVRKWMADHRNGARAANLQEVEW